MTTVHESTEQAIESPAQPDEAVPFETPVASPGDAAQEPSIPVELRLEEAEALRAWLLKPAADGATSLDDPLVSRVLARLGAAVDAARATVGIRQELQQVGVSVDHLTDEEIRILARRIADAGSAAIRS